jgi:Peptidase A4 family
MRHKWPVLAAVLPVMFGWVLIAAYPAGATPAVAGATGVFNTTAAFGAFWANGWVQPGGMVGELGHGSAGDRPRTERGRTEAEQTAVTSTNWAGYADTGPSGDFTDVTSSWVQPAGHCSSGDQYAAFWVGLDGYSSRTVEQIGSQADCVGQTVRYTAWYEIYPSPEVTFTNPVQAGDQLSASVSYEGSDKFLLAITDSTQHWKRSVTRKLAGAARSSAEVIAEAPCCTYKGGILPLTNFGTASFSAATVNNANLCTPAAVEITMPDTSVSSLSNCEDFTVNYTGSRSGIRLRTLRGKGNGF